MSAGAIPERDHRARRPAVGVEPLLLGARLRVRADLPPGQAPRNEIERDDPGHPPQRCCSSRCRSCSCSRGRSLPCAARPDPGLSTTRVGLRGPDRAARNAPRLDRAVRRRRPRLIYRFVPAERVPARAWRRRRSSSGSLLAGFTQLFAFIAPLMLRRGRPLRRDRRGLRAARLAVDQLQHAAARRGWTRVRAGCRGSAAAGTGSLRARRRPRREDVEALALAACRSGGRTARSPRATARTDARLRGGRRARRLGWAGRGRVRTSRAEAAHSAPRRPAGSEVRPASVAGAPAFRPGRPWIGACGHWGSGLGASSGATMSHGRLAGVGAGGAGGAGGAAGAAAGAVGGWYGPGRLGDDVVARGRRRLVGVARRRRDGSGSAAGSAAATPRPRSTVSAATVSAAATASAATASAAARSSAADVHGTAGVTIGRGSAAVTGSGSGYGELRTGCSTGSAPPCLPPPRRRSSAS